MAKPAQRASPQEARMYLSAAKDAGWIKDFQRLNDGRWKIIVTPTHYDHYHDKDATGVIALKTREVYAFIEGCWAGSQTNPTHRAGHRY